MALKKKKQIISTDFKWFDFDADTKILIAAIDNPGYQVALARLRREIQRNDAKFGIGDVGVVDGEKTEYQGQCALLANFIVKDWRGVEDEDGNPLIFSPAEAEAVMLADPEFFLFVIRQGGAYSAELRDELDETVEKPLPASSGKESGPAKPKNKAPSTPA